MPQEQESIDCTPILCDVSWNQSPPVYDLDSDQGHLHLTGTVHMAG